MKKARLSWYLLALLSIVTLVSSGCSAGEIITSPAPTSVSAGEPLSVPVGKPTPLTIEMPSVENNIINSDDFIWENIGPTGGSVYSLAINSKNPAILYAAAGGGIFKTTDGGNQWLPVNSGLTSNVSKLVLDPKTPEIIYAMSPRVGIYKSSDGGQNWNLVGEGFNAFDIYTLAIDPITPTTLYVGLIGSRGGVYKSVDSGMTWVKTRLINTEVSIIEPDPFSPGTIYAVADGGLVKSTDGGQKWNPASEGLPEPPYKYVQCLAVDPTRPGILYVGIETNGIYKSTNAGGIWKRADDGLEGNNSCGELVIDPSGQTIYADTKFDGFVKSVDGGQHWSEVGIDRHLVSRLIIDPQSTSTLYVAGMSGVVKSTNSGKTWKMINSGLTSASIYSIAIDPNAPGTMYAYVGTKDAAGGLYKTTDRGKNWGMMTIDIYNIDLSSLAIAPTSPTSLFMIANADIYKSMDGGANWKTIKSGFTRSVDKLIIDPKTPTTIYAVGYGGYRSTNGGESWKAIFNGFPDIQVETLVINPVDTNTIYALTNEGVYKSENSGDNWEALFNSSSGINFDLLIVDQFNPKILYGTIYSDKVKSLDGGKNWNAYGERESASSITAMLIGPNAPETFYMGTAGDGVYISTDLGENWSQINNGLYNQKITCFVFDPDTSALFAGTDGGGLFVLTQR
jgi:photosystem II stability/assembly factor-like uncharacterized protein